MAQFDKEYERYLKQDFRFPYLTAREVLDWTQPHCVIEGAGPTAYRPPVGHTRIRTLTSHTDNQDCLLFAFHGGHYDRLVNSLAKGEPVIYRNCFILIEECSDTSWFQLVDDGQIVLDNCICRFTQSVQFRHTAGDDAILSVAIPWAICAAPRLLVMAMRLGIGHRVGRISGSGFCWRRKMRRYRADREPDVPEETVDLINGFVTTKDYLAGYIWLTEFLKTDVFRSGLRRPGYPGPKFYNSPLDCYPVEELADKAGISAVSLPGKALFSLQGTWNLHGLFSNEHFDVVRTARVGFMPGNKEQL